MKKKTRTKKKRIEATQRTAIIVAIAIETVSANLILEPWRIAKHSATRPDWHHEEV